MKGMVLVADVGGTNTRIAQAQREGRHWKLSHLQLLPTPPDLAPLLQAYLRDTGASRPAVCACCGAGPLDTDGRIRLTNAGCTLDAAELAAASGARRALLVNDFEAVAHAIPALAPGELRALDRAAPVAGQPRIVIGAGTGLGVAGLLPVGEHWSVVSGEGGHVDLAPVDDHELAVWQHARASLGRVSAEALISGPGLERIHAALSPPAPLRAHQIAAGAWSGDPVAAQAVRLFTRWLGRIAGNLALTFNARGGVYVAGGIVPGWGASFDAAEFRAGFDDHAPHAGLMRAIPAFQVLHPQPGLLGLAELAERA